MKLQSLRLVNYLCFQDLTVEFTEDFNVVVGINGVGKTSLLEGVAEHLALRAANLGVKSDPNALFNGNDVRVRLETQSHGSRHRFERQYPAALTAHFRNGSQTVIEKKTALTPPGANLKEGAMKEDRASGKRDGKAALMLFYRASRHWNILEEYDKPRIAPRKTSVLDAFDDWWNASSDSEAWKEWVIVKTFERLETFAETGGGSDSREKDELDLVNDALGSVLEEVRGLRYDVRRKAVLVDWKAGKEDGKENRTAPDPTPFENLSDGQRVVIGLVSDIARRMCILNPQLGDGAITQTPGIVLIDELDIHLHPQWQRRLPNALQNAFPSLQFIVTTHSPQVLSELLPRQIVLLKDEQALRPNASYGLDSCRILEELMDTSAHPREIEDALSELFAALENNDLDQARRYIGALSEKAPHISEIAGAKALLKRKEVLGR
jgi:predicted ATP-binding protein involved in virulence